MQCAKHEINKNEQKKKQSENDTKTKLTKRLKLRKTKEGYAILQPRKQFL